jgi:hypothetical protein
MAAVQGGEEQGCLQATVDSCDLCVVLITYQ